MSLQKLAYWTPTLVVVECSLHSNLRSSSNFHSEHCNYLFIKDYWTTNSFLVDSLKHSKAVETLTKNALKTLKNGKIWVFCHFRFQ